MVDSDKRKPAMVDEFGLIRRLCRQMGNSSTPVDLGPGDDGALVTVPAGQQLVVSTDTLNADSHFFADADPVAIGHKSLAVNLSDLAAMGAMPRWVTLNLSLPKADTFDVTSWIDGFTHGFSGLAKQHKVALIGGDLCSGPLSVSAAVLGLVPADTAVHRAGAKLGDRLVVSGTLGDAAAALQRIRARQTVPETLLARLLYPQPRVALGQALRGTASSMIDISDGLLADVGHLVQASGYGATITASQLPLSKALLAQPEFDWQWPLSGGDDYELCFTLAPDKQAGLAALEQALGIRLSIIGEIVARTGIRCLGPDGNQMLIESAGWKHF